MKALTKIFKVAWIGVISILVFMILTVVVAKIFEDELASFTVEKLESKINAPMSVGKVSLIPLFSFPRLSAEINKLYIGDPESQNNDTLFFVNSLKVGLDTWDLFHGIYTIDEMEISGLDFAYEVDSVGKSNIDFIINAFTDTNTEVKSESVSTPLDLSAEKLKLENIHVRYYDSLTHMGAEVTIPEITLKAKTKNNIYQGKTKGSFILSHCYLKDTKLDKMESSTVTFDLKYDDNEAIVDELSIVSDGLNLGIEGALKLGDTINLNALFALNELDFDQLKKYLPHPDDYIIGDENMGQMDFLSLDINVDYIDNYTRINKLLVNSDGLGLNMAGDLSISDTMEINTDIESLRVNFNTLKKYLPKQYYKEFGLINIDGTLDASASIKGQYADSTLLPTVVADLNLKNVMLQTKDYPRIDEANFTAQISTGNKSDLSESSIDIYNFDIVSNTSHINLKGNITGLENTQYNLRSSMEINLIEFENLIPDSLARNLQGNIAASIRTSGILPKKLDNAFADYLLNNTFLALNIHEVNALIMDSLHLENLSTNINYTPQGLGTKEISLDSLNLKSTTLNLNLQNTSFIASISGSMTDPKSISTQLKSLTINQGISQLVGHGTIENFEVIQFDLYSNITLSLDEIKALIPDSLVKGMTGTLAADIHTIGKINPDSLESQLYPLLFENSRINLSFNDVSLAFPDSIMNFDHLSTRIGLNKETLTIDDFHITYNGLDLNMDSTRVHNIYKAAILNQEEELTVETHLHFGKFVLDDFMHLMAFDSPKPEVTTDTATLKHATDSNTTSDPRKWTFLIHGSASVDNIIVDSLALDDFNIYQLHINDLSTLFNLTDSAYIADQFKFKVFEGEMNNSINYKLRNDGTQSVSTHHIVQNMNIRTMLRDMDNFGMDSVITYENISGLFSTDLNTFVAIDDSILMDKMMVSGEIVLEKGGVYNYEPATEISKFTSIKELDNIQFKTLRSSIFMFKNKLYVPRTNIVSNALDIAAFGMQSLGGDSEFHLELHLGNILFGKSKRRNEKQDESDEVDEKSLKKSSRKIRYAVTNGKSKVGLDTKDDRETMINKIRVQQKMLDFIFFPKNIHYNTEPE